MPSTKLTSKVLESAVLAPVPQFFRGVAAYVTPETPSCDNGQHLKVRYFLHLDTSKQLLLFTCSPGPFSV